LAVKTPSVITDVLYADNTNYLEDNVDSKCCNFFGRRYRELAVNVSHLTYRKGLTLN